MRAAEEGIPLALIDRAAEDFGMPMGPIELADVVGLDVVMSVGKVFFQSGAEVPHVLSIRYEQRSSARRAAKASTCGATTSAEAALRRPRRRICRTGCCCR